jgi:hypothetical protein
MNVIPSIEQQVYLFDFYREMRNKHPISYDEATNVYAVLQYQDFRKISFSKIRGRLHYEIF